MSKKEGKIRDISSDYRLQDPKFGGCPDIWMVPSAAPALAPRTPGCSCRQRRRCPDALHCPVARSCEATGPIGQLELTSIGEISCLGVKILCIYRVTMQVSDHVELSSF